MFRLAETEFKLFIEKLSDRFTAVDPQIPPLPPKDVIYRIYRDVRLLLFLNAYLAVDPVQVRFSNDKTPYKTNFSATFSRSGRKGIFAGCMSFTLERALDALLINPLDHMYAHFTSFSVLCGMCSVQAFGSSE